MRKVSTRRIAIVAALACAAATGIAHAAVRDATAQDVASCKFVKDLESSTANKGKYTTAAIGAAMSAARKEAERAGATDIVWDKVDPNTVQVVTGKAYQCAK
jgi:hypothetical protein